MLSNVTKEKELPSLTRKAWSKFNEDVDAAVAGKVYRYTLAKGETPRGIRTQLLYAARKAGRKLRTRAGDGCVYWQLAESASMKRTMGGGQPSKPPARTKRPRSDRGLVTSKARKRTTKTARSRRR